jgi:integrase
LDWERRTFVPGRLLTDGQFRTKGGEAYPLPLVSWLVDYLEPIRKTEGLIALDPKGKPYHDAQLRRLMERANAEAGTPGLTPHRLRGTYATMLSRSRVPYQDIQQAMRHKSAQTTIGYLENDMANVARAQEEIAQITGLARFKSGALSPVSSVATRSEIFRE